MPATGPVMKNLKFLENKKSFRGYRKRLSGMKWFNHLIKSDKMANDKNMSKGNNDSSRTLKPDIENKLQQ